MHLAVEQVEIIRQNTHQRFSQDARVWLFGSHASDIAKGGGDINLLIETPNALENAFRESFAPGTALQTSLGDQKIGILALQQGRPAKVYPSNHNKTGVEP